MRFPDTPYMKRLFDLFDYLKLNKIEYKFSAGNTFMYYNDSVYQRPSSGDGPPPGEDVFKISGYVPIPPGITSYTSPLDQALHPFRTLYVYGGWDEMWNHLKNFDDMSMRTYLLHIMKLDPRLVNWLETFDTSTGSYDKAFSEAVFDSLAFDYPNGSSADSSEVTWFCIE